MVILQILEYNKTNIIEWESLKDCAQAHQCSPETIKRLIYYGGTLDGFTTFDIALWCTADIKMQDNKLIIYSTFKKPRFNANHKHSCGVKHGSLNLPQGAVVCQR